MNDLESRIAAGLHHAGDRFDLPDADLADVLGRTRRRSVARRVTSATVAVVVLIAAAVVVGGRLDRSNRRVETGHTPSTRVVPSISQARPVLDGCKATTASEAVVVGGSATPSVNRPHPEEVFADPARGLSGPLVVFDRGSGPLFRTGDGVAGTDGLAGGGKIVNGQVNGRDADFEFWGTHGGVVWDASSGGGSLLYEQGLSEDEMRTMAEQLDAGTAAFPEGLVSVGTTNRATLSHSTCYDQHGQSASITEIRGDRASRYREACCGGPTNVRRFDQGDSTIVIDGGDSGTFDTANATYHEATPEEWHLICLGAGSSCDGKPPRTPRTRP